MSNAESHNILHRFRPQVRTWFEDVFAQPTAVQEAAWQSISAGEHSLVVAPTGSGKTLAAFLWALNSLSEAPGQTALHTPEMPPQRDKNGTGVKVLYISPLKALGVDVQHNLRAPLQGINHVAARLGLPASDITVGVRSGDTTAAERNRQLRNPPDILITTPESAYLMLTSKAASILRDVETVIIDEIHALAGSKRGVHLALTLERLEMITHNPVQRIGLSATVRPIEVVAKFLGGDRPVEIINPPAHKRWDLRIHVPVADMSDLPAPEPGSTIGEMTIDDPLGLSTPPSDVTPPQDARHSIWPFIEQQIYQQIMQQRSTLVFVNSRRTAEKLTSQLNELYAQEHQPEALSPQLRRPPADVMKPSDTAGQAARLIARAHHGSVSKDERALTESLLKEGAIKAVIATSSLELGIDMGAVDLVIQVESPPSVASGLQRVGRAGHNVGAVSHGSFYPKHRADLVQSTVTVQRMREGAIEALQVPHNALDVLTQQTVAAVAMQDLNVDEWYATVTRAYPYRELPREVFNAVIDLSSGSYPSTDFAELKPRINFDRLSGTLSTRPGAQRVAVTSGGTIPDRGMFGVFLVGGEAGARRVGELDEEMVYESRVGDVFTLGASSWRIEEITRDQVLVSPAPGHTGRLPFWTGDQLGRPYELGCAVGAFRRALLHDPDTQFAALGEHLQGYAQDNLLRYIQDQHEATGVVPDERTLLLERFRDELGDWRVVLHTPFGRAVNAAWALAVGAKISQDTGIDAQVVSGDDGIVLRLPDAATEPQQHLFHFDPEDIQQLVADQVGNSALFAARFRECAARALLLPRRNPGKRAPLWQQRQRAAQLLDVARQYPSFPIILETVRECLHDVYDLASLQKVLEDVQSRRIQIAEVTTDQPSPFAASILFTYTGAFIYEGDTPLAEKRAAALALDPTLVAKLLGTLELRDLLDPEVIAEVDAQLRRRHPQRQATNPEQLVDALRVLGPVALAELPEIYAAPTAIDAAVEALHGRVMQVRIHGTPHVAIVEDAALLRDGLGIPVPPGVAASNSVIDDALEQLVRRWVRARGPFVRSELQEAFGLSASIAHNQCAQLVAGGQLAEGQFRQGVDEREYVAVDVLKRIRSRSLARARAHTKPVSSSAYGRFLPAWHQIAPVGAQPTLSGADGVLAVIEQLAGTRLPASAWETLVLPQRVRGYTPMLLDELTSTGEVHIIGDSSAGANDPWLRLLPADYAAQLLPLAQDEPAQLSEVHTQILEQLAGGGSYLVQELIGDVANPTTVCEAMWDLFQLGYISPDTLAPIRARLAGGRNAHRTKKRPQRSRLRMGRTSFSHAQSQQHYPDLVGRWALAPKADTDVNRRMVAHGEAWLDRYGVVTRGAVHNDVVGGFSMAYRTLRSFEDAGKAMRGYFIEGLGAAQFSTAAIIDRLRGCDDSADLDGWPSGTREPEVIVLAACDPANPYGAALSWPGSEETEGQHGFSRAAGAVVVLIDGLLQAHVSRGAKTLRILEPPTGVAMPDTAQLIVQALANSHAVSLNIENINGEPALQSEMRQMLQQAGAKLTPKGLTISQSAQPPSPTRGGRSLNQALEEIPAEYRPKPRTNPFYRR